MVSDDKRDGIFSSTLDSFQITEELVNNLSSKGFQGQGGNVADAQQGEAYQHKAVGFSEKGQ